MRNVYAVLLAATFSLTSIGAGAATINLSGSVPNAFTPGAADHVFNITGDGMFGVAISGAGVGDLNNANDEFRVAITLANGTSLGEQQFTNGGGGQTLSFTVNSGGDSSAFGEAAITVGCGALCNSDYTLTLTGDNVSAVPLPAAAWLFLSAVAGLFGVKRFGRVKQSTKVVLAPAVA